MLEKGMGGARARDLDGRWAEQRALRLLRCNGWRCLERRWRCRYGEIDLLMGKGHLPQLRVLAVEVKSRRQAGLDGWGIRAFGAEKRLRLARSLACWQAQHPWSLTASLEVVLALVALPPSRMPVRWVMVESLRHSEVWSLDP